MLNKREVLKELDRRGIDFGRAPERLWMMYKERGIIPEPVGYKDKAPLWDDSLIDHLIRVRQGLKGGMKLAVIKKTVDLIGDDAGKEIEEVRFRFHNWEGFYVLSSIQQKSVLIWLLTGETPLSVIHDGDLTPYILQTYETPKKEFERVVFDILKNKLRGGGFTVSPEDVFQTVFQGDRP